MPQPTFGLRRRRIPGPKDNWSGAYYDASARDFQTPYQRVSPVENDPFRNRTIQGLISPSYAPESSIPAIKSPRAYGMDRVTPAVSGMPISPGDLPKPSRLQAATPYIAGGMQALGAAAEIYGDYRKIAENRKRRDELRRERKRGSGQADLLRSTALPQINKSTRFARQEAATRLGPNDAATLATVQANLAGRAGEQRNQVYTQAGMLDRDYTRGIDEELRNVSGDIRGLQSGLPMKFVQGALRTGGAIVGGPVGMITGTGGAGILDFQAAREQQERDARRRAEEAGFKMAGLEIERGGLNLRGLSMQQEEERFGAEQRGLESRLGRQLSQEEQIAKARLASDAETRRQSLRPYTEPTGGGYLEQTPQFDEKGNFTGYKENFRASPQPTQDAGGGGGDYPDWYDNVSLKDYLTYGFEPDSSFKSQSEHAGTDPVLRRVFENYVYGVMGVDLQREDATAQAFLNSGTPAEAVKNYDRFVDESLNGKEYLLPSETRMLAEEIRKQSRYRGPRATSKSVLEPFESFKSVYSLGKF